MSMRKYLLMFACILLISCTEKPNKYEHGDLPDSPVNLFDLYYVGVKPE